MVAFALLIALAVISSTAVWGVWRFLIHEEIDRGEELNRPGSPLVYDPTCAERAAGDGVARVTVSVVGGPVTSGPDGFGVLYRLSTELDEVRWNADFNGDGDTDDLIAASSDADAVHRARAGDVSAAASVGGIRLLPDGDAVLAGFLAAEPDPAAAVVQGVTYPDGDPVAHESVGSVLGLERASVVARPGSLCWYVQPLPIDRNG